MRRWPLTGVPAWALALCGLVGLVATFRVAEQGPQVREPVRYAAGTPAARRLVVLLAPQLDERGLAALKGALGPAATRDGAALTVARPGFASFEETSLLLFAGNIGDGAAAPLAGDTSGQAADTLVRALLTEGRGAAVIAPAAWRALFLPTVAAPAASVVAPPKSAVLLAEAGTTLRARQHALVLVGLRDLAARDLRDEAGSLRPDLAALGAALEPTDALLLVGGGGTDPALPLDLSGAGVRPSRPRDLPPNDLAPTCAALLGAPYPAEARGRIAWPLLAADDARKATATIALARQRAGLVVATLPLGVPYPPELLSALAQMPELDSTLAARDYTFAYQLASSVVDQADRLLPTAAGSTPLPLPRRAAWWLVGVGVALGLGTLGLVALARDWVSLLPALAGGALGLAGWIAIALALQRLLVSLPAATLALAGIPAIVAGVVCAVLARPLARRIPFAGGPPPISAWRAIELLTLLAAFPAALCAYRYGLPWRLRPEESLPLFRWRSALLAPALIILGGYAWHLARARIRPPRAAA